MKRSERGFVVPQEDDIRNIVDDIENKLINNNKEIDKDLW